MSSCLHVFMSSSSELKPVQQTTNIVKLFSGKGSVNTVLISIPSQMSVECMSVHSVLDYSPLFRCVYYSFLLRITRKMV